MEPIDSGGDKGNDHATSQRPEQPPDGSGVDQFINVSPTAELHCRPYIG
ncbi:MAG: hypothetical protein GY820_46800 [Gammaproteobacteria bacterium]|nr:hypothetical protein [Gammaproteobacteria bacterium]